MELANGRLTLRMGPLSGSLEHWNYDTFRAVWGQGSLDAPSQLVTFRIDAAGRAAAFTTDVQGETEFTRADPSHGSR